MSVEDALKLVISGGLLTPAPPREHPATQGEPADAGAGRGPG
jgi:uncharacterized membrane protein